jgi:hypothetical protein
MTKILIKRMKLSIIKFNHPDADKYDLIFWDKETCRPSYFKKTVEGWSMPRSKAEILFIEETIKQLEDLKREIEDL